MWQTWQSLETFRYGRSCGARNPCPSDIMLYAHEFNSDPNFSDTFPPHSVLIQICFLSAEKSSSVTQSARRHIYIAAPTFEYLKYIMSILAWNSPWTNFPWDSYSALWTPLSDAALLSVETISTRSARSSRDSWHAGHSWHSRMRIRLLKQNLTQIFRIFTLAQLISVLWRSITLSRTLAARVLCNQLDYFHFWRFMVDFLLPLFYACHFIHYSLAK